MIAESSRIAQLWSNWPYLLVLTPLLAAWVKEKGHGGWVSLATNILISAMTLVMVFIIQRQKDRLEELSITDRLTGLFNSMHLRDELAHQVALAHRLSSPLSLIFMDVDDFKSVNDRHGHDVGNRVLRQFAQSLLVAVRQDMDLCFRFGGDEFLVLCPHTELAAARKIAERIFTMPLQLKELGNQKITLSMGLIQLNARESSTDFAKRADRVMYAAKQSGKNKIGLE